MNKYLKWILPNKKELKVFVTWLNIIFMVFAPNLSYAAPKEQDRAILEGKNRNLLKNAGFEARKSGWTATGASLLTLETSTPALGKYSAKWDPSASGEFLRSELVPVPELLKGKTCTIDAEVKWPSGVDGEIKIQVSDGTQAIAGLDLQAGSDWRATPIIEFTCPSSGSIRWELESTADAAEIQIEAARLGKFEKLKIQDGELTAVIRYPVTGGCIPTNSTLPYSDFSAPAGCPAPVVIHSNQTVDANDDDILNAKFPSLKKGLYRVKFSGPIASPDGSSGGVRISAPNTNLLVPECAFQPTDQSGTAVSQQRAWVNCEALIENPTTQPVEFRVHGKNQVGTMSIALDFGNVIWQVEKISTGTNEIASVETTPYFAKGEISGASGSANIFLSSTNLTGFLSNQMPASDLTLSKKEGNSSVRIACDGGNASTGDTCAAGNELMGVTFEPDEIGLYEICFGFDHVADVGVNSRSISTFKIIEVDEGTSTKVREGVKTRRNDLLAGSSQLLIGKTMEVCEDFLISERERKHFQMTLNHSIAGSITTNAVFLDRFDTNEGGRRGWYTIKKYAGGVQALFKDVSDSLKSKVGTSDVTGTRKSDCAHLIENSGLSIGHQCGGSWITSVNRIGTGVYDIVFANTYTEVPACTVMPVDEGGSDHTIVLNIAGTSTIRLVSFVDSSSADRDFYINCEGRY